MALKRRGIGVLVLVSLAAIGLVGAYFIVDSIVRSYAESRVRDEIVANLPAEVSGDVNVSIGGVSAIGQYLSGSFERVELNAPALSVAGAVASVHVVATGVPVDTTKPVGDVRGAVEIGPESLAALLARADLSGNPELELGDGTVSYTGTLTVLGFPIGYTATATPEAAGDSVVLTPTGAEITAGSGSLDVSGIVERILGQDPPRVCVARYLPAGVDLTGVNVKPERVRITLHADALRLTEESLTTLGTCAD